MPTDGDSQETAKQGSPRDHLTRSRRRAAPRATGLARPRAPTDYGLGGGREGGGGGGGGGGGRWGGGPGAGGAAARRSGVGPGAGRAAAGHSGRACQEGRTESGSGRSGPGERTEAGPSRRA